MLYRLSDPLSACILLEKFDFAAQSKPGVSFRKRVKQPGFLKKRGQSIKIKVNKIRSQLAIR